MTTMCMFGGGVADAGGTPTIPCAKVLLFCQLCVSAVASRLSRDRAQGWRRMQMWGSKSAVGLRGLHGPNGKKL